MIDLVVLVFHRFRYRKQVEEMQRAFNKTIIKLQNTSRMAEEQVRDVLSLNSFTDALVQSELESVQTR